MPEPLAEGFESPAHEAWEAAARKGLADDAPLSTTLEDDLVVPWLFTREDALAPDPGGVPGQAPFVRGTRVGEHWDIRQEHAVPTRQAANSAILEDLEGGVTAVTVRLDEAAREAHALATERFLAGRGRGGTPISTADDLDETLDGVLLDLAPVALDAGAQAIPAAALLAALWERRETPTDQVVASLGCDPIGTLAAEGVLAEPPADAVARAGRFAAEVHASFPGVRALSVDTRAYALAGATAAQELAIAISTATTYLRACDDAGLEPTGAAAQIEFTVTTGADQFLEIAKLRALRRMWARVLEASGVEPDGRRSKVYARTSPRMLSAVDPWVNMLRGTIGAFAAGVGGADGVTVTPFDAVLGEPGMLGRRVGRNTQLVLLEESALAAVADPGAGSWYVEWLTDAVAKAGWEQLQQLEGEGGALAALTEGSLASTLAQSAAVRADELAHRKRFLTGTNSFPLLGDDGVQRPESRDLEALAQSDAERLKTSAVGDVGSASSFADLVELAKAGARIDELAAALGTEPFTALPLAPARAAQPFEALRAAADEHEAAGGSAPKVLLACLGPMASHNAFATWAINFFGVGGVVAEQTDPLEDAEAVKAAASDSDAPVAAVCCAKDEDPELIRAAVTALREGGAELVVLVGGKDDRGQEAGADAVVRDGIDMIAALERVLKTNGVALEGS